MPPTKIKEFQGRGSTRVIGKAARAYETSFQRIARVRNNHNTTGGIHAYDHILAHPERFKSPVLRGLIHLSALLEELGENIADISGLTERVTRNAVSSGEKYDDARIMASAAGRAASGQLNMFGFSLHKAVGASFYLLSTVTSLAALAYATSKYAKLRQPEEIQRVLAKGSPTFSLYLTIARKLQGTKQNQIEKVLKHTKGTCDPTAKRIRKWAKQISRNHRSVPEHMVNQRRANFNYMMNNMHQYGPLTRGLLQFSFVIFQGVNKMLVSFDKHVGTALGRKYLAKPLGDTLGCRLALTVLIAASAALSVPMAPLAFGLSSLGIAACVVALMGLILARINVKVSHDWKGDICDSKKIRFSAA